MFQNFVLLKCMIDNFETLNLIKLIPEKVFFVVVVCFLFSIFSVALLIVDTGFEYCLSFHMLCDVLGFLKFCLGLFSCVY